MAEKRRRRPPVRRRTRKSRAQSQVVVTDREGETHAQMHHDELLDVDIPEGPAVAGVTHGVKWWGSTRENGMTVDSTSYVEIPCASDTDSLALANDKASELAFRFAFKNGEKMHEQLQAEFAEPSK